MNIYPEAFRMVQLNAIACCIVVISLLIWIRIYPKKNINLFVLLLILSLLPLLSILRTGTYESGDLTLHSTAALSFYQSLAEGNLIPRWAGEINYGYGSVYHLLMYFLPRFIPALFHLLGIPILLSMKLFIALCFIFSGIGMYKWAKNQIGTIGGFSAGIFYLYAPYHLLDTHFRVSSGEILAFAVLPFNFYFLHRYIKDKTTTNLLLNSLLITILLLSHQAIASFGLVMLFAYGFVIINKGIFNKKTLFFYVLSFAIGTLLASFYVFPLIFESKYTIYSTFRSLGFLNLKDLLYSPYRYGLLFQGPKGELAMVLGYIQWIMVLIAVIFFRIGLFSKHRNLLLYLVATFLALLILMLPISKPFWESIPILRGFESTYRLLLHASFVSAAIAGLVCQGIYNLKKSKKKSFLATLSRYKIPIISLIIAVSILQTVLNWGNRRNIPTITEDSYFEYHIPRFLIQDGGLDYAQPIFVDPKGTYYRSIDRPNLQVVAGEASIRELPRTSTHHQYLITVSKKTLFRENTFYFPGWKAYSNLEETPLYYKNPSFPGIISFELDKGIYHISVVFEQTTIRKVGDTISFVTGISIAGYFLYKFYSVRILHRRK